MSSSESWCDGKLKQSALRLPFSFQLFPAFSRQDDNAIPSQPDVVKAVANSPPKIAPQALSGRCLSGDLALRRNTHHPCSCHDANRPNTYRGRPQLMIIGVPFLTPVGGDTQFGFSHVCLPRGFPGADQADCFHDPTLRSRITSLC